MRRSSAYPPKRCWPMLLQVMPSFFSVSPSAPLIEDLSEGQVWFRSLRKSTVRQRRSAVGHGRNALLFFKWIEDHFRLPECDLPFADSAGMRPDLAATMLRAILGYGENPLPEMTSLAEAHGIRLFSLPTVGRSEERRVGKECRIGCRSRWSPYH